jgi:hypothetical protein
MLQKCANPACLNPFRKLSEGKLFLVESPGPSLDPRVRGWDEGGFRRIEHFWLCGDCAAVLTLSFERGKGIVPVPLNPARKRPTASVPATTIENSNLHQQHKEA